ncbi:MAG: endonuclease/exonuclease/phosphatase family protein [Fimbriimonadaceae bacterium]
MLVAVLLAATMPGPITFMSFNVRYATADDGANAWALRQGLVYDAIARRAPGVLGVQEALASQIDDLLVHLPGYAYVGVGRDDGKRAGEFAAVFYKRAKFEVEDSGTFWLSDTPELPGSKSWGNTVVRVCTWARLKRSDGPAFTVFNAHFDHESQPSRERSSALVLSRVLAAGAPSVLMGDLNAGETNAAVASLKGGGLADTFRALKPDEKDVGTFNGFDPKATKGEKIDYVFVTPDWKVLDAGNDRTTFDARCPSDHWPVWAVVELEPS